MKQIATMDRCRAVGGPGSLPEAAGSCRAVGGPGSLPEAAGRPWIAAGLPGGSLPEFRKFIFCAQPVGWQWVTGCRSAGLPGIPGGSLDNRPGACILQL